MSPAHIGGPDAVEGCAVVFHRSRVLAAPTPVLRGDTHPTTPSVAGRLSG